MNISNIIIITVLVLIVLFLLARFFFTTDIIYDVMLDAKEAANSVSDTSSTPSFLVSNKNVIESRDFNENNTSNFMLSVWFYIDNWGNEISEEKNILYASTKSNSRTVPELQNNLVGMSSSHETLSTEPVPFKNLNIGLDKYENNLFIDIETYSEKPNSNNKTVFTRYLIKNIPVQKWNCLTISVDTKTLDVYLDGKLRNSFILHGIYRNKMENNKNKNLYLGNLGTPNIGFEGFITRVRYQPQAINPQEAYNIYKEGINASLANSLYNKYGLKVSFLEYNKERGSFVI